MSRKQQALWQEGQCHSGQRRWSQAAAAYQSIVEHDPSFVPAWLELARAKEQLGSYRAARDAVLAAARVTAAVPPMAGLAVARLLRRYEALPELDRYVQETNLAARLPAEKLIDLAAFFSSAGCHTVALQWVEHALKRRPDLFEAHNMRGLLYMFAGDEDAAREAFERALRIKPDAASTYSALSRLGISPEHAHHVDEIERLLDRGGLSLADEVHLSYALHNQLHARGEYSKAWSALERACAARKKMQPYNAADSRATFDQLQRLFTDKFCESQASSDSTLVPIFIVGMHRSGTTLLERMLSGHTDIADSGETYTFAAQLRYEADHYTPTVLDSVIAERMGTIDYERVGQKFLHDMRWRAGGKAWITEKMNPNFLLVGAIAKALPNAVLIHMRRDPVATCFSNLRTLFTIEGAYSYDQLELADYYAAYLQLMKHWEAVLPGRLLQVDYHDLVAQPEHIARRVSEACGLEFQLTMLDVGRRSGMVATASVGDVRKGILSNRDTAWRAYEDKLSPLLDRLALRGVV